MLMQLDCSHKDTWFQYCYWQYLRLQPDVVAWIQTGATRQKTKFARSVYSCPGNFMETLLCYTRVSSETMSTFAATVCPNGAFADAVSACQLCLVAGAGVHGIFCTATDGNRHVNHDLSHKLQCSQ